MREGAAVAVLAFLSLSLPLGDAAAPGSVGSLMLVATVVGTLVARRRAAGEHGLVRVLHRATVASLVAWGALLVLVLLTGQGALVS